MKKKLILSSLMTLFITSACGCSNLINPIAAENNTINFTTAAEASYNTFASFSVGKNADEVKLGNEYDSINGPCSFFVDESGSVYLLNTLGKNIIVKNKGETKKIDLPNINTAADIYVGDYIYVYDSFKDNPSVIKLDKAGLLKQVYHFKDKINYPEIYKFKNDKEYGLSLSSGGLGIIPLNVSEEKSIIKSKASVKRYAADIQDSNKVISIDCDENPYVRINFESSVESVKLLKDDDNIYFHTSILELNSSLIQYKNVIGILDIKTNSSKFLLLPSKEYFNSMNNTILISKDNKIYFMLTSKNEVKICKIK